MIKNENAFQKMLMALEIFLETKVKVILRGQEEIFRYITDLPRTWQLYFSPDINITTVESAQEIWRNAKEIAINPIITLAHRIDDFGLVITDNETVAGLAYIIRHSYQEKVFYESWLGGFPATGIDYQRFEIANGFSLPSSYQTFCSIHNGFLKNGNSSAGYLPIHKLIPRENILPFCGDGVGNFQAYDLKKPSNLHEYITYDWDHETRELSKPSTFWAFWEKHFLAEFR